MTVEQFSNNSQTSLSLGVTSSATTLNVADYAGSWPFPTSTPFRIVVSDPIGTVNPAVPEIMTVTAGAGSNTWTVTRGVESTTAIAHAASSIVTHVLTAGGLSNYTQGVFSDSGPQLKQGAGSPEGVVTAAKGSAYLNSNGGAGTTFYVKESGVGNTGWVAK